MPKAVKPLTNTEINKAKPKEKKYSLSDGGGLYLIVKPNGIKTWMYRYTYNSKRKETTFDTYPNVSLKEARDKRDQSIKLLNQEIDPITYKREEKEKKKIETSNTFEKVMYAWLEHEKPNTSFEQYQWKTNRFEKDVLPFLIDKRMSAITIQNIVIVIKSKNNSAPETASKLFGYLKSLFSFAVLHGYCERNLLLEIKKSHLITKRTVKHMAKVTDKEIFKELVNSIYNYHGGYSIRNCLKLVLHLPLRAENLCALKWSEIDFEKKLLTIPREQMKLKNPNIDDFKVPLTDEVLIILKEQKEELQLYTNELDYVFLGANNKDHINKESPNKGLQLLSFNDEKKGRKIRLHGFRGTFRSMIDTLDTKGKFSFETKERVLDHHEKSKTVRAYSHKGDYIEHLKELLNFWSEYIVSMRY